MAVESMDIDIDNLSDSASRCLVSEERLRLADAYAELANADVDLRGLNWGVVVSKLQDCYSCIKDDLVIELPGQLPRPRESVNNCIGSAVVPLEHIKQFVIFEATAKNEATPHWVEAYSVTSSSLPYNFIPSADLGQESGERYWIWWEPDAIALAIKVDAEIHPETNSPPPLSFNIASVSAEFKDEYVEVYGSTSTRACTAMLMTNGITWEPGYGLDQTVDSNPTTYSKVTGNPAEVVVLFQFKV